MENKHTREDLKKYQSESLEDKYQRSMANISSWYEHWDNAVYVSFSGGKDSSVLADMCAQWCKHIGATLYLVFVDTGLEYPEIRRHVKFFAEWLRNEYGIEVVLDILRPKMRFDEVIKQYGYPIISKEVAKCVSSAKRLDSKYGQVCRDRLNGTYRQSNGEISLYNCEKYKPLLDIDCDISHICCDVIKKNPAHTYVKSTGRKPITAQMACESRLRERQWIQHGCNGFDIKSPVSNPMSFWMNQDVLRYIKQCNIPIVSVYGDIVYADDPDQFRMVDTPEEKLCTTGCDRTGCIFCGFGCHLEKGLSRFERLKLTHPKQYEYCIGGGEHNIDGIWQPNKKGLGMGHVFDELNKIYGDGFIRY